MNTTSSTTGTATTSTGSVDRPRDRHVVLRHRLRIDGAGVAWLGGGYLLVVMLFVVGVSFFTEIRISGWEAAATQLVRWFVGAIGVYLTAVYLPLYVVHGRTRREVATDMAIFAGLYAALAAVLVTVGYAVERLVYRVAGWPQTLDNDHLFDHLGQWHLVTLEYLLVLAVWVVGGAMLGAAFYRNGGLGMLLIPVAIGAVFLIEGATGPGEFGPIPPPVLDLVTVGPGLASPALAVATAIGCCVAMAGVTWRLVRDTPIRNQPS